MLKRFSDLKLSKLSAALTDYIQSSDAVKREVTFFHPRSIFNSLRMRQNQLTHHTYHFNIGMNLLNLVHVYIVIEEGQKKEEATFHDNEDI